MDRSSAARDGVYGTGSYLPLTTYECTLDNQEGAQIDASVTTPAVCP
jgi:hypothetical protein